MTASVVLVSCVATKCSGTRKAKDLYMSDWFLKARAYVEARSADWRILSAKHGLLGPERWIRKYSVLLAGAKVARRRAWAKRVRRQLVDEFEDGTHFEVLAGKAYCEFLFPPESPFTFSAPLQGMRIGQQKRWFLDNTPSGRLLVSAEDASPCSEQPTRPCSDCAWSRKSAPGWLGQLTAEEWVRVAHGEDTADCHALQGGWSCAGLAIYRSNVAKRLRDRKAFSLPADREAVFSSPAEFLAHHSKLSAGGPK